MACAQRKTIETVKLSVVSRGSGSGEEGGINEALAIFQES
jgi:hypothetical protein